MNKAKFDAALQPLLQPISELLAEHGVDSGTLSFKVSPLDVGWEVKAVGGGKPRLSTEEFEKKVRSSPLGAALTSLFGADIVNAAFADMRGEKEAADVEPNAAQLKWGVENLERINAVAPHPFTAEDVGEMVKVFINEAPPKDLHGYDEVVRFREELAELAGVRTIPTSKMVDYVTANAARISKASGIPAADVVAEAYRIAEELLNDREPCGCGKPDCFDTFAKELRAIK